MRLSSKAATANFKHWDRWRVSPGSFCFAIHASGRRAILERFREECGTFPVAGMRSVPLQNILNRKTPSAQRNWKEAQWSVDHCLALKLIKEDPLDR